MDALRVDAVQAGRSCRARPGATIATIPPLELKGFRYAAGPERIVF